jgi:NhaP-type Na+/H+ or K+/H+ antiporter
LTELGWVLLLTVVVGYALVSKRLARTPITGPMIFVVAGLLIGPRAIDAFDAPVSNELVGVALEVTLALVLFTDALATNIRTIRRESFVPGRLLGVGFPLTIAAGLVGALLLFDVLGFWEAAIVAVILVPTDAALGQAVVANPRVPPLVRHGLSIESGLNDGLAVPVLAIVVVQAQIAAGLEGGGELGRVFLEEIGIAIVAGMAVGWLGGKAVVLASKGGWMGPMWRGISVTALALLTFVAADSLGGSGFVAAFVGGATFGSVVRDEHPNVGEHSEGLAYILTMLSFFIFGAIMLGPILGDITIKVIVYAALSLTVIRMLPVAMAMIGTDLHSRTVAYLGWFGPRGLASLVFVVTIVTDSGLPNTELIIAVVTATVGLSVFAHGATAWPGSRRYADWHERMAGDSESAIGATDTAQVPTRRRVFSPWTKPHATASDPPDDGTHPPPP